MSSEKSAKPRAIGSTQASAPETSNSSTDCVMDPSKENNPSSSKGTTADSSCSKVEKFTGPFKGFDREPRFYFDPHCAGSGAEAGPRHSSASEESPKGTDISTSPPYLSLICASRDYKTPNPGGPYLCHPSKGRGIWLAVIDSGFTVRRLPQEFRSTQREIRYYQPPPWVRVGHRYADNTNDFIVDDSMDDKYQTQANNGPPGHGTRVAIVAGGSMSGVAPLANLLLCKEEGTVYHKKDTPSGPTRGGLAFNDTKFDSIIVILEELVRQIDEGLIPKGKVVINYSCAWYIGYFDDESNYSRDNAAEIKYRSKTLLAELSKRGVTIVLAAGNKTRHRRTTGDYIPQAFAASNSSIIIVGGTDSVGGLLTQSLPGTTQCPVCLYAQGKDVLTYDLATGQTYHAHGTSLAAPQVAGVAAYFLGHPDYQERFRYSPEDFENGNTVGMRMKMWLQELAYQRISSEDMKEATRNYTIGNPPSAVNPLSIDVVYNNWWGPQK